MSAAGGQHPASPGGLHPGSEAVFLAAVPLFGLIGLLHWKVCFSPFGLGARIPRKARERAWAHESALARLPADYMYLQLRVSNADDAGEFLFERLLKTSLDTPGEYTISNRPEPCSGRWGGAILRRPAAPDNPGHWPRGTVRTARTGPEESWTVEVHGATKASLDWVSVTNLAIHSVLCSGLSLPRWTRSKSGARHWESYRSPCLRPTSKPGSVTPSSSKSTTTGSESRCPTVSPRIGWRRATAP